MHLYRVRVTIGGVLSFSNKFPQDDGSFLCLKVWSISSAGHPQLRAWFTSESLVRTGKQTHTRLIIPLYYSFKRWFVS